MAGITYRSREITIRRTNSRGGLEHVPAVLHQLLLDGVVIAEGQDPDAIQLAQSALRKLTPAVVSCLVGVIGTAALTTWEAGKKDRQLRAIADYQARQLASGKPCRAQIEMDMFE